MYSESKLLEIKNLKISNKYPINRDSSVSIHLLLSSIKLPTIFDRNAKIVKYNKNNNRSKFNKNNKNNSGHKHKHNKKWVRQPPVKPLTKSENAWKCNVMDESELKKIRGILNKLSPDNYDEMVKETLKINYTDPKVVDEIFNKAVTEPFFSDIYAKFCMSLIDLHDIIRDLCEEQFKNKKHVNLCKFIGELYKLEIVPEIGIFISVLYDDLTDINLEILCKLITTVGIENQEFEEILIQLEETKDFFKPRFKFMIMDVLDLRIN